MKKLLLTQSNTCVQKAAPDYFMRSVRAISFLLALLVVSHSLFAQKVRFNTEERRVIELTDSRTGQTEIAGFLSSKNEKVAWRAAIGLANIADSNSRPVLLEHLSSESRPYVRDAIAFALGILGPNEKAYEALRKVSKEPSDELAIAMARTVPKENIKDFVEVLGDWYDKHSKMPMTGVASALTELGLRKILTDDAAELIGKLSNDNNATVRWQAVYAFARCGDSALVARHLDAIKDYSTDLGSDDSRMFAALAYGAAHNDDAEKQLVRFGKSETEWRTRVNICLAISRLPKFSEASFAILKKAVEESTIDSLTSIHVANAALSALDNMIDAGKLAAKDSVTVRTWLAGFKSDTTLYPNVPNRVKAFAMIPAARFGTSGVWLRDIGSFYSLRDTVVDKYVARAIGNYADTLSMLGLITRVLRNANELPGLLDGMHQLWKLALKNQVFYDSLEAHHLIEPYRHLVIRLADHTEQLGVVAMTMEMLKEPKMTPPGVFHDEAEEYLLKYLDSYNRPERIDHLLSIVDAIQAVKPTRPEFADKLKKLYETAATKWYHRQLSDLIYRTFDSLGIKGVQKLEVPFKRDSINWMMLETCPDTILIQTKYGPIHVHPNVYEAPLSVLNILKLSYMHYFDDRAIHRLVPNFVIQTGDVTESGYGGPGYTIRTEIAPIRYDKEGVAGMASDGKDTEGSQWFITHCPTPHLNTRYTIWGSMMKGFGNLDKLQYLDRIENVIPYR